MVFGSFQSLLVWIDNIYSRGFIHLAPLLTKERHNLSSSVLYENVLISILRLILPCLSSFRTFSYCTYFHSEHSPIALIFIVWIRLYVMWIIPFPLHLKAQTISLKSPASSNMGGVVAPPPNPSSYLPPSPFALTHLRSTYSSLWHGIYRNTEEVRLLRYMLI